MKSPNTFELLNFEKWPQVVQQNLKYGEESSPVLSFSTPQLRGRGLPNGFNNSDKKLSGPAILPAEILDARLASLGSVNKDCVEARASCGDGHVVLLVNGTQVTESELKKHKSQ